MYYLNRNTVKYNYMTQKQCSCCQTKKPIDQFVIISHDNKTLLRQDYCTECKGKARCHTCKQVKDRGKFYMTQGLINKYKCKACYKEEYIKILRESPL